MDEIVRELSEKMVAFLETGTAPEGLFAQGRQAEHAAAVTLLRP
jgi:hypothetical protein